jgi:hypothetical protein
MAPGSLSLSLYLPPLLFNAAAGSYCGERRRPALWQCLWLLVWIAMCGAHDHSQSNEQQTLDTLSIKIIHFVWLAVNVGGVEVRRMASYSLDTYTWQIRKPFRSKRYENLFG